MTGQTLSHYRVLEKIGEGGTGVVYKAEDLALGRAVALKFLPPELSSNSSAILRFQLEARTASSLNHPNICTIYEIAEEDHRHFIAMELLEGDVLSRVIHGRALEPDLVLELAIQIVDALAAAHAEGVVHRDIKPANIFVTRRDQAKVLDFGLALLAAPQTSSHNHQLSQVGSAAGTVPYMSPEQARGEDLDARTDLFSMGIVLYEMTTGRRAFMGRTIAEIRDAIFSQPPIPARELNPMMPAELDRIITKALEKNRKLRYQTASDMRADLQRLKRDFDSSAQSAPPLPLRSLIARSLPSGGDRWRDSKLGFRLAVVVLVGGAVTAAVFAAGLALRHPPAPPPEVESVRLPAVAKAGKSTPAPSSPPVQPPVQERDGAAGPRAVPAGKIDAAPAEPSAESVASAAKQELRIARTKIDAQLYDQAILSLRDLLLKYPRTPEALDAYFLMAGVQERKEQFEDAMATYLEIADRYRGEARAPEALFHVADLTLRSKRSGKTSEALKMFAAVAAQYPQTSWAARALIAKAEIESRGGMYERDAVLGRVVPSAMISYRRVAEGFPTTAEAAIALKRLAESYEDLKLFDLAARTYSDLASGHTNGADEAWFRAGELYRRRLKDAVRARAAYERVPATSRYFENAQKQLKAVQP